MFFCLILFFQVSFVLGQDSIRMHFAESITAQELKSHLTILSSDEFMGRETATEGQRKAAQFLVDYFKKENIAPGNKGSYIQSFTLIAAQPDAVVSIDEKAYTFLSEFYFYDKYKVDFSVDEIVFAGYGIDSENYSDYTGISVQDKVVLILEDEPTDKKGKSLITKTTDLSDEWSYNWRKKYETAVSKGAKAVITVVKDYENKKRLVASSLRGSKLFLEKEGYTDGSVVEPPRIYVSNTFANALLKNADETVDKLVMRISKTRKSATKTIKVDLSVDFLPNGDRLKSSNILAFIEGTDKKEEVVVITAHYDHLGQNGKLIYNGADDDGSGTVALMEIAQAFKLAKEAGHGPRRSILFMPVSGEEKGLLGSDYYSMNPVYPIMNTIADLNIDMIGRHDSLHENSNYIYVIGADRLSTELHEINEEMNNTYSNIVFDYTYNEADDPNQFYYRSDHYNFAKLGIPSIFFFSGVHEDYHRPTDTVEKIEFEKMTTIVKHIFYTAWELANREKTIEVDQPIDWD